MLEGHKVVTADEMARIEKLAIADGASEEQFMDNAGRRVADYTASYVAARHWRKEVTLLVGKGNNGGDAFAAGVYLLDKGFSVTAWHIFPPASCTPLCQKMRKRFEEKKGVVRSVNEESSFSFEPRGVILDGLIGTGMRGSAEGLLAQAIVAANQSGSPILSIDIPSGVSGNTGQVSTVAIRASETIYLGLPKWGFFVKEGWNYVGKLVHADFGLEEKYIAEAKAIGCVLAEGTLAQLIPPLKRTRHKYEAGYVLGVAGSRSMPGAAILSSYATLRSGAGIIRLFHPPEMDLTLSAAPWEIIRQEYLDLGPILDEVARADALFIGPGLGRTKSVKKILRDLLDTLALPTVLDADALFFLAEEPKWKLPERTILTPHRREMERLLKPKTKEIDWIKACQKYAEDKKVTIILKGPPTFIFHPGTTPLIVTRGDPGMATAGSGDVLTGIVASLLAQKLELRQAAALAAALHGIAGEIAAMETTSYCMVATDLLDALPKVFSDLLLPI